MDMSLPLFPAPDGYIVNLADPQRSGKSANFWVGSVGMVLATFLLSIRIYTKTFLARNFSADDWSLLLAWAFSITIQIIILFQYGRGTLGVHIWELPGSMVNSALNLVTVASILYCPFLACAKFSLLFFYLKLSHLSWFRIAVYANMFLVVGYNLALVFPLIFACSPVQRNFDVTITEGSCMDRTPVFMATAVLNMLTDIILLVLPIPMILKLQMPKVQKAGVLCIFAVGSATCVTSAVRLILLFPMLKTIDQTWAIVTPGLWILIEANLVIITGSLPVMRLFFRHVAPRWIGESSLRSRSRTTGRNNKGTGGASHGKTIGSNMHRSFHQSELKSFGPRSNAVPDEYGRISDDEFSVGSVEDRLRGAGTHEWKIESNDDAHLKANMAVGHGEGDDAGSETAIVSHPDGIVMTRAMVVKTETRES